MRHRSDIRDRLRSNKLQWVALLTIPTYYANLSIIFFHMQRIWILLSRTKKYSKFCIVVAPSTIRRPLRRAFPTLASRKCVATITLLMTDGLLNILRILEFSSIQVWSPRAIKCSLFLFSRFLFLPNRGVQSCIFGKINIIEMVEQSCKNCNLRSWQHTEKMSNSREIPPRCKDNVKYYQR